MQFCRERHGNRKEFVCPYHQWSYTLTGDLQGVPLRRGVRQDGQVQGRHAGRLQSQGTRPDQAEGRHARRRGVRVVRPRRRAAGGLPRPRPSCPTSTACSTAASSTILGYNRQRIPGNWKLMQENIKDPYHPGLLHTWFVTFGLWRADNKSQLKMDAHHRHAA
jgi:salicylate 5-hydroxylase large subunit